jgi:hypothetical protein
MAAVAGLQLFLGTERTDDLFAWTIEPPLTAAFLGACYLGAVVLLLSAARAATWSEARVTAVAGFVLIALVLLATLIHVDLFHTDSPDTLTKAGTWAFIATYVVLPPAFLWLIVRELRLGGDDPPRRAPLPRWALATLAFQGGVLAVLGAALLVAPTSAGDLWPWELTALTGRATGAWAFSIGLAMLLGVAEADWIRLRGPLLSYTVLGGLQLVALLRYPDTPDWDQASAWLYTAFLVGMIAFAGYGWRAMRRSSSVNSPSLS